MGTWWECTQNKMCMGSKSTGKKERKTMEDIGHDNIRGIKENKTELGRDKKKTVKDRNKWRKTIN